MQLRSVNKNLVLAEKVEVASTFWQRLVGLLGRRSLDSKSTLWIHGCSSIHTFFMQFPIDVIFVDENFKVCKVIQNIKPWRMAASYFCGHSVFEFASPNQALKELKKGDLLHVGD